jgi:cellulose synthase/poly-beta-1,6-N-acetylglucosamine synthase-like glycosyltransferase
VGHGMVLALLILRIFLVSAVLFFAAFYVVCFGLALLKKKTPHLACSFTVSVVIPARNEEGVIDELLVDLKDSSYPITETIVVDDNSSDSTYKTAKSLNAKVIRNGTTLGKAASINKAA